VVAGTVIEISVEVADDLVVLATVAAICLITDNYLALKRR